MLIILCFQKNQVNGSKKLLSNSLRRLYTTSLEMNVDIILFIHYTVVHEKQHRKTYYYREIEVVYRLLLRQQRLFATEKFHMNCVHSYSSQQIMKRQTAIFYMIHYFNKLYIIIIKGIRVLLTMVSHGFFLPFIYFNFTKLARLFFHYLRLAIITCECYNILNHHLVFLFVSLNINLMKSGIKKLPLFVALIWKRHIPIIKQHGRLWFIKISWIKFLATLNL